MHLDLTFSCYKLTITHLHVYTFILLHIIAFNFLNALMFNELILCGKSMIVFN
ncbi:MAG: hypothetical protein H6Q18_487 [Bacteroidetes bacterium]|nr:hypothetical protein [Bacteroidota bacterium]